VDAPFDPDLDDWIVALPPDGETCRERLAHVRRAVLLVGPYLEAGDASSVGARDLRSIFIAIDLHVFGARYHTAFENAEPAIFVWQIEDGASGVAPHVEFERTADTPGLEHEPTYIEFCVAPGLVGHASPQAEGQDVLGGLLYTMLRLMLIAACAFTDTSATRALGRAARLFRSVTQ
jgi:hypothetical protein